MARQVKIKSRNVLPRHLKLELAAFRRRTPIHFVKGTIVIKEPNAAGLWMHANALHTIDHLAAGFHQGCGLLFLVALKTTEMKTPIYITF